MSRYKIVSYEEASPEVKSIYDESMKEMGLPFVLNWLKCQGSNATLLKGNWEKLKNNMLRGEVPFLLKQLIIYNISSKRGCQYCSVAHGLIADSLSESLTGDKDVKLTENMEADFIPSSYKVAIQIVTKAAFDPKSITDEDFEELRDEGYSESEIHELLSLADLTNMINTFADISGIKIDNELMEAK
ncbi:carboxymuconolactone decarboxylase family protein [Chondrinema litorale]|uniref:carboxymuconolactone decarboxylase family protein n=1 Tax=Chondrinema litorale TaxID=2994555 RepID=UPI002542BD2F|nr:carboxymuconolactone decarboxylase family protein [Chondrinema litorale]UZR99893.1 carboxymuconolactone decarboxylase family protein [Chondrinema litorale]